MSAETQLQCAIIRWWALACKAEKLDERLLWHTPNGGKRGKTEAAILKGMGVRAGVPDLFFAVPRFKLSTFTMGLFIELKSTGGALSPSQIEMLGLLESQGYACCVCWSAVEGISAIVNYLKTGHPLLKAP